MRSPSIAPPRESVAVNGRYRLHRTTGVQRYAHEIVKRLGGPVDIFTPKSAKGAAGHLWEQTVLPIACRGRMLWSPCASGPLAYTRQIVTFHDLFPLEYPEWYGVAYRSWYSIAMRRLASSAVHLIAVSEYTKSRLVNLLGRSPDDITVIHNGCESHTRVDATQIAAANHALKLPTRRYILSLSSLESRKNINSLLLAWEQIHQQLPEDTWLILAGPKADASVYGKQDFKLDLPRVLFTGYVPDEHLSGLYSGASLFVFPSLAEGFGLPLLEAMACGVRCITSNTSSLPEVGGDVVDYVDPKKPMELGLAILRNLSGEINPLVPYLPVVERALRFTWDSAARRTQDVIDAALAGGSMSTVTARKRMAAL